VCSCLLLCTGLQDASDATIETLKAIDHPISKTAQILVEACSFAGTGNVLKIQAMLHHCDDHITAAMKDATFPSFAVIVIALNVIGKDIGAEMSLRQFNYLVSYYYSFFDDCVNLEFLIKDAIWRTHNLKNCSTHYWPRQLPLTIGLVSASNPHLPILDTLSKYSHDNDFQVAINAIFAMGLVGAGTNNARLAQMLRQLAGYYQKEPDSLFMVHMGKGTIGLNPFFSDRSIMSRPAVAGLLATLTAFTDAKSCELNLFFNT
jgi:26S proteasome regulatory subunit N1